MRDRIEKVFSVSPLKDDPPQGEIKVVANIGGEAPVVTNKDYQLAMQICFSVKGKNLDLKRVWPVLEKFRRQLEGHKFDEDGAKVWPVRMDEFQNELIRADLLICSQHILWQIYDRTGSSFDGIQSKLLRDMRGQKLEDDEISIHVTDAVYHDGNKRGRWPKEIW
jgi:hypothetical protein